MEEIGTFESFKSSLELCRNGLLVGPSSGLALRGLLKFLTREKAEGRLDRYRNQDGEIPCEPSWVKLALLFAHTIQVHSFAVINLSSTSQSTWTNWVQTTSHRYTTRSSWMSMYMGTSPRYGARTFSSPHRYNVDWEIPATQAHAMLFDPTWKPQQVTGMAPVRGVADDASTSSEANSLRLGKHIVVLDLRDKESYAKSHIPGSVNLPVDSPSGQNPYKHPPTMVSQFRFLDKRLSATDSVFGAPLEGKIVFTLSYRGHVGRLAMSVLRNREIQAHCVMGGYEDWQRSGLWGSWETQEAVYRARL